jgi:hypothetical protein
MKGMKGMKSIYLDQNVFGHLLDKGDWKTHPIGKVLDDHDGDVGVWVSPTHVIELSQATNHARRSALARLMLELCGTRRMWHGSDFHLIEMFGAFQGRRYLLGSSEVGPNERPLTQPFPILVRHRARSTAGQAGEQPRFEFLARGRPAGRGRASSVGTSRP